MNILLGVCGTVEADKTDSLINLLLSLGTVRLVTTKSTKSFLRLPATTLSKIERFSETDEMGQWRERGDPILHIDLVRWAEALIIAPLTANTLAKIANGMADGLLTEIARSWSREKPFIVAPAITKEMYAHNISAEHLKKIVSWGVEIVSPNEKDIAISYSGVMAPLNEILHTFKCKIN